MGFESPLGETSTEKISPRISFSENISFILEDTKIFVSSEMFQTISGNRFFSVLTILHPASGKYGFIQIYGTGFFSSLASHHWSCQSEYSLYSLIRIQPLQHLDSTSVITAAAYNAYNNSLFKFQQRIYKKRTNKT